MLKYFSYVVITSLMTLFSGNAITSGIWSFEKHPQPTLDDLTIPEFLAFRNANDITSDLRLRCRLLLNASFSIYLNRYPDYLAAYDEREQLLKWREHMAQNTAAPQHSCFYTALRHQLEDINASDEIGEDFLFSRIFFFNQLSLVIILLAWHIILTLMNILKNH